MGNSFGVGAACLWVLDDGARWMPDDLICSDLAVDAVQFAINLLWREPACRRRDIAGRNDCRRRM